MTGTALLFLLLLSTASCQGLTTLNKVVQLQSSVKAVQDYSGNKYNHIMDLITDVIQDLRLKNGNGSKGDGEVKDCSDPLYKSLPSGVRVIWPDGQTPMTVYCDQVTDGGGWTVFQRRKDGSVDFYRTWAEYQDGFGRPDREFWLGLDSLHLLTSSGRYELRVDMSMWNETKGVATYSNFNVDDSGNKYQLHVGPFTGGNAGDSLSGHNGMFFSTKDSDNDIWENKCAQVFHGAFWHGACHSVNLNGLYHHGGTSPFGVGINWFMFAGHYYSLQFAEMKVRPHTKD